MSHATEMHRLVGQDSVITKEVFRVLAPSQLPGGPALYGGKVITFKMAAMCAGVIDAPRGRGKAKEANRKLSKLMERELLVQSPSALLLLARLISHGHP